MLSRESPWNAEFETINIEIDYARMPLVVDAVGG